jgi:hypothetical protein
MGNSTDLTANILVMASLGERMRRGIVVEPPPDHPRCGLNPPDPARYRRSCN